MYFADQTQQPRQFLITNRIERLGTYVLGESSTLSVPRFDRAALIAVLNWMIEHLNTSLPVTQRERRLGDQSDEFKKTFWTGK